MSVERTCPKCGTDVYSPVVTVVCDGCGKRATVVVAEDAAQRLRAASEHVLRLEALLNEDQVRVLRDAAAEKPCNAPATHDGTITLDEAERQLLLLALAQLSLLNPGLDDALHGLASKCDKKVDGRAQLYDTFRRLRAGLYVHALEKT